MRFFPPARQLASAICILASLLSYEALGANIGGSIRFSDERFSVSIDSIGQALRLSSRGCNNFDLILHPADRAAGMALRDSNGRSLGTIGNERTIETRTCGAERYSTEILFGAPTRTTWTPQAEELVGATKVKYSARLTPVQMRFDPPIEISVYEKNSRSRPIRIANVATAEFQSSLPVDYSANALHFSTRAGTIQRTGGFTADDEFFLESESQLFARPENGQGEQITFEAPSDTQPTSLSLYYAMGGPHILAFTADERQREPTPVKSLRVDDEQLLMPRFAITRSEPLIVKRGFFRFASGEQMGSGTVQIALGSAGSVVNRARVTSSEPTSLQVASSAAGPFSPSLDLTKISGGSPVDIALQVRIPANADVGAHNFDLTVTSEGGLKRTVSITVNVSDPYAVARTTLLTVMVLSLIAAVAWTLIKRRRITTQAADARSVFFQKHYGDYSEVRERIETALASDSGWLKADEIFRDFEQRGLHTVFTPQRWNGIRDLERQQKGREALEALDRALGQLEG